MTGPVYVQRPSKAVTRLMLVEMLQRLGGIAPTHSFQYVGFGALEFADFELVHRRLGITKMTSIEQDGTHLARYRNNRPYSGIRVLPGQATDVLPTVSWKPLSVIWLDYECRLNNTVIADLQYLCQAVQPGSAIAVTLNAQPGSLDNRRAALAAAVGEDRVPPHTTDDTLGDWGQAEVQQRISFSVLRAALRARGAMWEQLLNVKYRDDARMQLVAGLVTIPAIAKTIANCGFSELSTYRPDRDALTVEVPYLTTKEQRTLNERLPRARRARLALPGVDQEKVRAYESVYRWLERSA